MPAEPFSWNAVVIGAWNTAILTPDGVRKRLFDLPTETPIELEVALDQPGQFRVGHGGLVVVPTSSVLEVTTRQPDAASLERACHLCARALVGLPETPVSAVGVNVRYRFAELPDSLLDLARAPVDNALADAGYQVVGANTRRSVTLAPGLINIEIKQVGLEGSLEFNFHRNSAVVAELAEWLGRATEFVELSDRLAAVLGVANVRGEVHA